MVIGSKKIFIERLSSTNSHAAWLLRKGKVQEGTVICAGYQTAGRGQGNNRWESETGKNLLFSIVLYPVTIRAEKQFSISRMISLGIRDFLLAFSKDVFVKWPNDIYVRNDKIAGILIENAIIKSEIEHTIAGIGININQTKFPGDIPNPASLKTVTGRDHDIEKCLDDILACLDKRYRQLGYDKKNALDKEYLTALYRYDQWTEFQDSRGIFEGRIIAVTDSGRLQIEDRRSRTYEYEHGEVNFL